MKSSSVAHSFVNIFIHCKSWNVHSVLKSDVSQLISADH